MTRQLHNYTYFEKKILQRSLVFLKTLLVLVETLGVKRAETISGSVSLDVKYEYEGN